MKVAAAAGFILLVAAAGLLLGPARVPVGVHETDPALVALLQKADARMAAKVYAAPGGDSALDLMRMALKAAPDDAEVKKRQRALADVFEARAQAAERAGDYAEAAVQLSALALLEPGRPGVADRLKRAEDVVVNQATAPR